MKKKERIVCGLDVGTRKTRAVMLRVRLDDSLEVIGTGSADSCGLANGVVANLDETAASAREAATEAELNSGLSIDWVTVAITGDHIESYNCQGVIPINGKRHEVTAEDIDHAIVAARSSIPVCAGRDVIHILNRRFLLDKHGTIRNPIGLTGLRLDADVHIVTCEAAPIQNLINAVNKAGMNVRKVVLHSLASGEAVLAPEEKEIGVAVVDIGHETTNIALYENGSVCLTSVLKVGGGHFTRDLYKLLSTSPEEAERIKTECGSLLPDRIADDALFTVRGIGPRDARQVPRNQLCAYLEARALDLLELIRERVLASVERHEIVAGAVFTGGGSRLAGMEEFAGRIMDMRVRAGLPQGISGLPVEWQHPDYACVVGLAIMGARDQGHARVNGVPASSHRMINKILSWTRG